MLSSERSVFFAHYLLEKIMPNPRNIDFGLWTLNFGLFEPPAGKRACHIRRFEILHQNITGFMRVNPSAAVIDKKHPVPVTVKNNT